MINDHEIKKLKLSEGDTVVLQYKRRVSCDEIENITRCMIDFFERVKLDPKKMHVLIIDNDAKMTILTKEDPQDEHN